MQQQINLLSAGLIPPRATVTSSQVLTACGVFAGLLLLISAWDGYGLYADRQTLASVKAEAKMLSDANTQLRDMAQREPNPSLAQSVAFLIQRRREEQQLRAILAELETGRGFTHYLTELSLVQVDGLWLDSLVFGQGDADVALRGYAFSASKVPEFLQRIAHGSGFQGQTFDRFELTEAKDGNVRFEIVGPVIKDSADTSAYPSTYISAYKGKAGGA
jgi:hypothetical protein